MKHTEQRLRGETKFHGTIIDVVHDTVLLENGREALREVARHRGAVGIFAMDGENVVLVRQFRYPFQKVVTELPAGKLEPGEEPFEAAKRELAEECGLTADRFVDLQPFYPTVGYCSEVIYTWLATGLHPVPMHLDEGEFLTPEKVPFAEALAMVLDGRIRDGKTVAGLLKVQALRAAGKL